MKFAAYLFDGKPEVGILDEGAGQVARLDLSEAEAERGVLALVRRDLDKHPARKDGTVRALPAITMRAPMPHPVRNIFCVGKNYYDHAHEFSSSGFDSSAAAGAVPKVPIIFSKVPECVSPHGAPIPVDAAVSTAIDYEVELAVIIGRGGRGISRDAALDHVWGYTIINDVTARDLQGRHSQWLIGKSQDGFCPMGPYAVPRDNFNLAGAGVRCFVNDELRQNASTDQLIFDVPHLIETLSAGITLQTGDIIATGTPAGVGIGFKPPRYLAIGDTVRAEIDGIGALENLVAAYAEAKKLQHVA